jgi:spore coat protein U-like protein
MNKIKTMRSLSLEMSAGLAAVGVSLLAGQVSAAANADLEVGATVAANCTISTAPVAFGSYDPVAGATIDLNGTVTVACTTGSATTITLGQGLNADNGSSEDAPLRRMEHTVTADTFLSYQLFTTAGRNVVWGNTLATSVAHEGTGTTVGISVFGRLPSGQNVPVGTYSDTVIATVTF